MTTLTTTPEGRRTFILTMATSVALLLTVGLMSTLSDTSRPTPVIADATPPGVKDAVIIPADQYDSLYASPVVAAAEPVATPVTAVAATEAPAPAPVQTPSKPVRASFALTADSQAEPAAAEAPDNSLAAPVRPIKVALAMTSDDSDAATVR